MERVYIKLLGKEKETLLGYDELKKHIRESVEMAYIRKISGDLKMEFTEYSSLEVALQEAVKVGAIVLNAGQRIDYKLMHGYIYYILDGRARRVREKS